MDGGAWWAMVHGVAKSRTQLSHFTFFLSFFLFYLRILTPNFTKGKRFYL